MSWRSWLHSSWRLARSAWLSEYRFVQQAAVAHTRACMARQHIHKAYSQSNSCVSTTDRAAVNIELHAPGREFWNHEGFRNKHNSVSSIVAYPMVDI